MAPWSSTIVQQDPAFSVASITSTSATSITCHQDRILQHMTHLMDEGIMQFGYILEIMQHNHGKVVNHNTYRARKHLHHAMSWRKTSLFM